MSLLEIFKEILTEDKVESFRKQFVEKQGVLTPEDFNKLVELDESPRHKYLQALIRWFIKYVGKAGEKNKERERLFWEDLYKINEYLDLFERHKKLFSKKDIFQYSYEEFKNEGAQVKQKVSQMDVAKARKGISKHEKYKEFYVGNADGYDVYVIPKGRKDLYGMSCELGSGTEWCTATGKTRRHFDYYIKQEPLFIIIKGNEKYQFGFVSEQFMDKYDYEIENLSKFKNVIKLCLNSKWIEPVKNDIDITYYLMIGKHIDKYDNNILVRELLVSDNEFIVKFPRIVHGHFTCHRLSLKSLKGAPEIVSGDFFCNGNQLTSLEGAPEKVGGEFNCRYNKLQTLKGAPKKVGGDFYCNGNQLTSLEGAPEKVGGNFYCNINQLKTLEGAPEEISGDFNCSNNQLTSLEGAPEKISGDFYCNDNQLTSLKGAPEEVGGDFYCNGNQLTSLEGAPKKVGGDFYMYRNAKKFTEEEVRAVCDVSGKIFT